MEKQNDISKAIVSIFGEEIVPYVSVVTPEGEENRANVGLEIWRDNNEESIILSPKEAKELANRINTIADEAYEANYNLLVHKAPF